MEWMILPYKRYFDFAGRSQRKEYWMFVLLGVIVQLVLDGGLGGSYSVLLGFRSTPNFAATALSGLFGLVSIIPSLAVGIRRLHDTDRSGWWLLIGLIPLVGTLILLYFVVSDGTPGPNRFGEDPKGRGLATVFS
ncbi:DUF805 domain-containing protein [Novosphingobium sp.]|jgi:uncharacterized membrane protein YhaH (DUF805 family)|uniref:DUF805 domain-containing protein n=1 Tax=Novosphingobium sp. TaxID=1874826 RepID=UPI0031E09726